jgi:hypothetical protein
VPKLNVYIDDVLLKRVRALNLPASQICRDALWEAIWKLNNAKCRKCKEPAGYAIRRDSGGVVYACTEHVGLYLGDKSEVHRI